MTIDFSKVKYFNIAPFIGLDSRGRFHDARKFGMHRARLPRSLFKEIIRDVQSVVMQYGPPHEHQDMEATSRFLAPVSNLNILGYASSGCIYVAEMMLTRLPAHKSYCRSI